jgi:hypothetical protein
MAQVQAGRQAFPTLRALEGGARPPWRLWGLLVLVAVGGSAVYGASLARAVPGWELRGAAVWLVVWTGLAWCLFGPVLVLVSRRRVSSCAHACLVTMACGIAVLLAASVVNALGVLPERAGSGFNAGAVGVANAAMCVAFTLQMRALRVPAWKSLALWMGVLNGGGALFAWLLAGPLLHR